MLPWADRTSAFVKGYCEFLTEPRVPNNGCTKHAHSIEIGTTYVEEDHLLGEGSSTPICVLHQNMKSLFYVEIWKVSSTNLHLASATSLQTV